LLAFVNGASDEFDNLYDAIKLKGNKSIAFYSLLNKQELAIQSFTQATGRSIPRKIIPKTKKKHSKWLKRLKTIQEK